MKLTNLLNGTDISCPKEHEELEITGVTCDSREVHAGNIFLCIKGYHTDGNKFASEACLRGAAAVVSEEELEITSIPVLLTKDARAALSRLSSNFYRDPTADFTVFGVTGTNGKTTITYMLEQVIKAWGRACGIVGTISYSYPGKSYESTRTTPESDQIQALFAEMKEHGVDCCAMEVSSHALTLGRINDVKFDFGIFTNLTPDHMDFHKDAEDYYQAKKKLFYMVSKTSVINVDDTSGKRLYGELRNDAMTVHSYSLKDRKADFFAEILDTTELGSSFCLYQNGEVLGELEVSTPGLFTIYNALATAGASLLAGVPFDAVREGLKTLKGVPGRFERVENSKGILVFVDYAHTPDALEKVLKTALDFKKRRLICVFGCGGERDHLKRPVMGKIAGEYSDYCIITSDNPRSENQDDIAADIEAGIYETGCNYEMINGRLDAIKRAVEICQKGDIIMIAGKGHETYQLIGTEKYHFDDREAVKSIIEKEIER